MSKAARDLAPLGHSPKHPNPLSLSLSKAARCQYPRAVAFYAYLLRCNDGSYYAGHTDDLDYRLAQHQAGILGGYTAKRRPVVLVWCDTFPSRDEAFFVERRLKGWSRAKKEALIAGDWGLICRLARGGKSVGVKAGARPSTSSG